MEAEFLQDLSPSWILLTMWMLYPNSVQRRVAISQGWTRKSNGSHYVRAVSTSLVSYGELRTFKEPCQRLTLSTRYAFVGAFLGLVCFFASTVSLPRGCGLADCPSWLLYRSYGRRSGYWILAIGQMSRTRICSAAARLSGRGFSIHCLLLSKDRANRDLTVLLPMRYRATSWV